MRRAKRRPGWQRRVWVLVIIGISVAVVLLARRERSQPAEDLGAPLGTSVPDLALPSTSGHPLSLGSFRGKRLVVYFYEGATCGPCQQQLVELQTDLATIHSLNAGVVAVSVDPIEQSRSLARQLHLGFPIVEDRNHHLGSAFGDFRVPGEMDMGPVDNHAIFIVGPQGTIVWKKLAPETMHVSDSDVITALRKG